MTDLLPHAILAAVLLAAASGLPSLLLRGARGPRAAAALLGLASVAGLWGAVAALLAPEPVAVALPWALAGERLLVRADALSALFLVPIFTVPALGALYGTEYFAASRRPVAARALPLFYGLTTAGMALLTVAANAFCFLVGWEVMALAAFVCMSVDHRDGEVRRAGYVYLGATRLGTLCLFGAFALLRVVAGSFDFPAAGALAAGPGATAVFLLALAGFGIKAGLIPVHAWLPGAHAGAPSHVSAMMSGVLIKTGVYGLVRFASFFAAPPAWWGVLVVAAGLVSAVLGVALALGQHDLKRLLAYHSVENIGIIVTGVGVALLGRSLGRPEWVALGLAGALLHVWNHAAFKGLLFFGAGAVIHAAGTRDLDHLGGVGRPMPRTAALFLLGAVAICGLPPLNGFVSELFLYVAALGSAARPASGSLAVVIVAPVLAAVGALAVACFTKAYGAVFLGAPRSTHVARCQEPGAAMLVPMALLGVACVGIGLAGPALAAPLDRAIAAWSPAPVPPVAGLAPLWPTTGLALAMYGLVALLAAGLARAVRGAARAPVWDCGYAAPTARMQYTSSSFAQFPLALLARAIFPVRRVARPEGPFPRPGHLASFVPEPILDRLVAPAVDRVLGFFARFRRLQSGAMQPYLAYLLLTLVAALLWVAVRGAP